MPLAQVQEAGAGNVLLHHFGWGHERSRGASEYEAFVDVIVNMQDQGKQHPRRRRLEVKGRWESLELLAELAVDRSGFARVESDADASAWDAVHNSLPTSEPGWSAQEIYDHRPSGTQLTLGTIKNRVATEARNRGWACTGDGKPHHPYRYSRPVKSGSCHHASPPGGGA